MDEALTWLDPKKLSFHWDGGRGPIRLTVEEDRSVLRVHALRAFPLSHPDQMVHLFAGGKDGAVGDFLYQGESVVDVTENVSCRYFYILEGDLGCT